MPKYDDIEHEGTEDFAIFQNRQTDKKIKTRVETVKNSNKEEKLNKLQEKWLSPENPYLWDGDVDFD